MAYATYTYDDLAYRRRQVINVERKRLRRLLLLQWVAVFFVVFWLLTIVGLGSGVWLPSLLADAIVDGPSIAYRNAVGQSILSSPKHILKFEVAGHKYEVRTPGKLTPYQENAYLAFAKSKGLPIYSADGPLAVDP